MILTAWLEGWTREENKKFESALVTVEESTPNRWEVIASMVGGNKSADDVHKHYLLLVKDVELIESGVVTHIYPPSFAHWSSTVGISGKDHEDDECSSVDSSESAHQEQEDDK